MNINTGLNPYNSNFISNADRTKMSQSQSLTGSVTDSLKEGEVFEGSVNAIDGGKVVIGLANGQTMTARLDTGVSLTPGQSVFFEVKSNDGNLVQIRPVSLTGLDANPTLLKALDMANLAATERTINMVNTMMQNSMSVSPENLAAMNRAMINNPGVDMQTLVTMAKHDISITPDNVNMFENYAADKAVLTDNFDAISEALPELMLSGDVSSADVISLNNSIREIFAVLIEEAALTEESAVSAENLEAQVSSENLAEASVRTVAEEMPDENSFQTVVSDNDNNLSPSILTAEDGPAANVGALPEQAAVEENEAALAQTENTEAAKAQAAESELGTQALNSFATDKEITSFNTILNNLPDFPKDNMTLFAENGSLKADADVNQLFKEITDYLNENPDIPKETLNDIIREPLYKGMLKSIISNSFAMEPKDVTKPGEISKLYEKVLKQSEALEKLVSAFGGKSAETIKNQTAEIKQNINFMNSANEMYNFVQIPLKMYNQNTDSMLYVRQNKKSSYEAGEEITAFLHFDMEYLGSTDVFISLRESNVGCKWNLASEESMDLIEQNLDILTERLAAKGFNIKSEVTCGNPKADFVQDFLGEAPVSTESPSDGLVHRYSFDMRA